MAEKPIVALVGRPNVGKSTLFNRLVGERLAVTHEMPGTTRDRLHGESFWTSATFQVIDTGGIEVYQPSGARDESPLAEGSAAFVKEIIEQALIAIADADVIILLVDAQVGVTAADEAIAEILRRSDKPVLVAANKIDDRRFLDEAYDFYSLGLDAVIGISAIHGLGIGDLLDELVSRLGELGDDSEEEDDDHLKIAILGRPNAGKSTLLNKLIGAERAIVSEVAGTTRDAIDTDISWHDQKVTLIDTAGIRRRGRIEAGVERYSVIRAMRAIARCDVALLVIDAQLGVTEQDEHIAGYIIEEYKSLVIVINKWDALEKDAHTMHSFIENIRDRLHFVRYAPIIFISALDGQRIHQVLEVANRVWEARFLRMPTADVNKLMREAIEKHPPQAKGVKRLKFLYASQVRTDPPLILFHVNDPRQVHFSYKRYLENQFRAAFQFEGTPIRMSFRSRDNKRAFEPA
ncbi:MAG: ribosome biogenesis GTPase Der [Chloroflexota bacterium]|nr:ribosome biogenesis GTPase Der [Chloroflexota bacterium]MDE2651520.1 ribosome biogenesis GTPase Der [Chloroflexota bacterium]